MTYATLVAVALVASLVIYALGGGADFGGGVWDLLAAGPRAGRQRETIAHAIGPIWEANHVWLILAIVLLFTCFPAAFAAIGTALHIPITVLLVGIVLRGSAFTFRSYGLEPGHVQERWGRVFAWASLVSPIMLGVTLGAISSGTLGMDPASGQVRTDFISSWCASFPFAVGFLALALFAYLAAVYLTLETEDDDLRDDFRKRALIAWEISAVLAIVALALARHGAPLIFDGLMRRPALLVCTGLIGLAALSALARRRYAAARWLAAAQVALTVSGWALAQYPAIVPPDLTITSASAPEPVVRAVLEVLVVGALLLFPALFYLFRIFKSGGRREEGSPGYPTE
ncbi:MAG TPA: cytochrome d ubiquinol oxidase subunit II [Candidatus Eisenbacteria bacterium]|nr:cytochrome d ubiquinol oxidase subunit II [Candidatus Eisenbacteria bacterium]